MKIPSNLAASRTAVPAKTLADWRRRGFLSPITYRQGLPGRRPRYSGTDLIGAVVIRRLRERGVPLQVAGQVARDLQEQKIRHDRGTTALIVRLSEHPGSAFEYARTPDARVLREYL